MDISDATLTALFAAWRQDIDSVPFSAPELDEALQPYRVPATPPALT